MTCLDLGPDSNFSWILNIDLSNSILNNNEIKLKLINNEFDFCPFFQMLIAPHSAYFIYIHYSLAFLTFKRNSLLFF